MVKIVSTQLVNNDVHHKFRRSVNIAARNRGSLRIRFGCSDKRYKQYVEIFVDDLKDE